MEDAVGAMQALDVEDKPPFLPPEIITIISNYADLATFKNLRLCNKAFHDLLELRMNRVLASQVILLDRLVHEPKFIEAAETLEVLQARVVAVRLILTDRDRGYGDDDASLDSLVVAVERILRPLKNCHSIHLYYEARDSYTYRDERLKRFIQAVFDAVSSLQTPLKTLQLGQGCVSEEAANDDPYPSYAAAHVESVQDRLPSVICAQLESLRLCISRPFAPFDRASGPPRLIPWIGSMVSLRVLEIESITFHSVPIVALPAWDWLTLPSLQELKFTLQIEAKPLPDRLIRLVRRHCPTLTKLYLRMLGCQHALLGSHRYVFKDLVLSSPSMASAKLLMFGYKNSRTRASDGTTRASIWWAQHWEQRRSGEKYAAFEADDRRFAPWTAKHSVPGIVPRYLTQSVILWED